MAHFVFKLKFGELSEKKLPVKNSEKEGIDYTYRHVLIQFRIGLKVLT